MIDVIVIGGSLVGLSAAMFLGFRGVKTVLVEKHHGSSPHPRAIGYTERTMELFRAVGLRGVPEAPAHFSLVRAQVESLAGEWRGETTWTPKRVAPAEAASPVRGAAIAQDLLEPMLREHARALGAELRLGEELVRFAEEDDGVTAWLASGETLRARYLVAADGAASPVREALGITRSGRGRIRVVRSVLFRAPLDAYLARGPRQFEIQQEGFEAFLTTYGDGRWVLMLHDDVERDEETLRALVQRAIGRDDVPVEILTTGRWDLTALVADRFSSGRVFLAGDAAHALPPTRGGFGANTGIHDAWDLSWKLAEVLRGRSRPTLLETYDAERRPTAWRRHQQTFARPDYAHVADGIADGEPILDDEAMELGQLYRSSAVLGVADDLPPAKRPSEWRGQPGTRAPHVWLSPDASTLDWFGKGWVVVGDEAWRIDGAELRAPNDAVRDAFGLGAGASLVRPDGVVAWRSGPSDTKEDLERALRCVAHAEAPG